MSETDHQHIHQIDGLRGLAAVSVAFGFHMFFLFGVRFTGPLDGLPVLSWLYDHGWTMVDLFFVISGFVFSHVYLQAGALRPGTTARSFVAARIARLYPLHLVTLVLVIPPIAAGAAGVRVAENSDLGQFVLNLLLLQASDLEAGYSFNVVSWSISVEMLCYLLFFAAARTGSRAFTLLAALAILAGIALSTLGTESGWHIGRGLSGFFAGHFAWRLRHRKIPAALLLTGTVLPVAFAPAALSYGQFLGVTAFPAAVLLALKLPVLSTRPFRWLGARSYSIYLWHPVIYFALRGYIPDFELVRDAHPALLVAVAFATVLIVSDLSYRWFETPMRHWLRARLAGRPSRAGLAAQSA
ncbi:MAG: acyltransferase [Maritimibacter sp.]|nr:acyltransferase [Maritimibacter sp.]